MLATKVVFKHKSAENERLELTDKNSLYFLGPDLMLKNCDIVLKVPSKNLLIRGGTHFLDCRFDVKQELKIHQGWIFASLEGCQFKGRLSGCDFGHWPTYAAGAAAGHGAIEDCDFTEAVLDGCRFMGCDPRTLRFPRWPCFTFLNPRDQLSALQRAPWGFPDADIFVESLQEPDGLSAVTIHAIHEARRCQTTPEAFRAVIENLDDVIF